ncbi:uncharacterized protein LOC143059435 [Mytilus galloprovincialis]|uniref:uncharacterized protein LOC143059435 n=1 Tax=Mytilus galloprovincialis TaxID=29158 RepID=UPI003F7CBEBB
MSLSAEESNFLRFYFLNLKIASKAVRTYFDSVHPPSGLASELANCSVTLKRLRFITNSQLKILYPSTARNVRSEDFDTTLMVCLLRNMTPHECAPRTGWDNLPLQGDASTGADLARVKWYRNMLTHHEDGKLSPVDFIQYWTDLESAILRLGGPSLHQESQSAQHIVLDTSLTDMLNTVRNCQKDILNLQMSHEKHTSMITDLQTTLHNQKLVKEKHETEIQLLQDSLQKGETVDQNLATKLSDATVSIAKSKEEIKACHKEIETNEVRFKDLQEQLLNKQIQIDKLVTEVDKFEVKNEQQVIIFKENGEQIRKHDRKLAKQSEQLAEHDEQIALNAKDIDDIKKKQHNTDDSSSESRRKRLEDDTKALIKEDLREGTFVTTEAAEDGLLLLKQNGVLLITGHAGTGKSRISRHILHMFCTEYTSFKCIKLDKLQEWEDMVNRDDNVVILLDDIFGETNCIYNREKDIPILDKVHAYVCKSNIKVLITIRDTVKRQCQVVFDSHRLFKFDFVDLSSDKYKLCEKVKQNILTVYMKTVRQSDYIHSKGFVDQSCNTIMQLREIYKITNINPVKGFPLAVYQFVHSDKYFQLGFTFFDRPTETILDEINEIRRQGEIHKKFMIQYGVMVYTAINEHGIDPDDNSNVTEVVKIIDAIYGETIRIKRCQISDAVMELKGSYLVKIPNQRSYRYHHPTLQESVILSFAQIDNENLNKIIPLLSWTFFMKMVKPYGYNEKEGEVVLKIPTSSYKLLAYRLADIYTEVFRTIPYGIYNFLESLSNTEIFQNVDCVLLTYILDVVEKTDQKNHNIETMIRFNDMNSFLSYLQKKDVFLAVYLVVLATKERQLEIFQFILQRINQIIRTKNCYFTIDYIKAALITSLYQICSKKDVKIVKYVKSLMDIVEINRIPVLLDQNIQLTEMTSPLLDISIFDYYNNLVQTLKV